jgi:hypothetical protein
LKQIGIIFLLVVSQGFGQWEYNMNDAKKSVEAIGKIKFNVQLQDTIIMNLSNSRRLGLDFSIQGKYFKSEEKYYVLFEISGRKIKVLRSIIENNNYRIFELKDLISNEKFELEDFLKILKRADECFITIRSNNRVIQGNNQLYGSATVINNVISGRRP